MTRPKTWRQRLSEALEGVRDRLREGAEALDDLLAPPPEPVPVPVAVDDRDRRRRRR